MKTTKLINWRKVSELLSGHPEGVRSTYSGKRYKEAVNELLRLIEDWKERYKR